MVRDPLGCLREVLKGFLDFLPRGLQDRSATDRAAGQHPHTVGQQATVTGRTNIALYHRAIGAQLPPAGYFVLDGQMCDTLVELLQRLRLDQVCPPDESRVVRHTIQIHPAKLPQPQAVAHVPFRFFITIPMQPLHHQHPQHHVHRCRTASRLQGLRPPLRKILLDQAIQFLIFQIRINLHQFRRHLWNISKNLFKKLVNRVMFT